MRQALGALRGLTLRGRCFVAAGLAAVVCGAGLGEKDLIRVGVLVVALPLVCAVVVARTRYRMSCTRRLRPARVPAGSATEVSLHLANLSRLPTGLLLVEDALPYALGTRPRFVVDRVEPQGEREIGYPVPSQARGRFTIGPLALRLADPFGMVELAHSFSSYDELVVTPPVERLPAVRLGGAWTGGGDAQSRAVAAAGEDDVVPREYRRGDELRRVDWRSTARRGELMVRREEQPWQSHGAIILDTRAAAHRGHGPGSSFEWAVAAAASIGCHLAHAGYALRLVTDTGEQLTAPVGSGFTELLLDRLATMRVSGAATLAPGLAALSSAAGEGLVVAICGLGAPAEADSLARVARGGAAGIAVLVDATSWGGPRQDARARDFVDTPLRLHRAGWRVLPAHRGCTLAELWPAASRDAALLPDVGDVGSRGPSQRGEAFAGNESGSVAVAAPPPTRLDRAHDRTHA
jgi:uncharacterized protein (DUF58 family)